LRPLPPIEPIALLSAFWKASSLFPSQESSALPRCFLVPLTPGLGVFLLFFVLRSCFIPPLDFQAAWRAASPPKVNAHFFPLMLKPPLVHDPYLSYSAARNGPAVPSSSHPDVVFAGLHSLRSCRPVPKDGSRSDVGLFFQDGVRSLSVPSSWFFSAAIFFQHTGLFPNPPPPRTREPVCSFYGWTWSTHFLHPHTSPFSPLFRAWTRELFFHWLLFPEGVFSQLFLTPSSFIPGTLRCPALETVSHPSLILLANPPSPPNGGMRRTFSPPLS